MISVGLDKKEKENRMGFIRVLRNLDLQEEKL